MFVSPVLIPSSTNRRVDIHLHQNLLCLGSKIVLSKGGNFKFFMQRNSLLDYFHKTNLKQFRAHIHQPMIRLPCICGGKTAVLDFQPIVPTCVVWSWCLKECFTLLAHHNKGSLRHRFSLFFDPMVMP